MRQHHALGFARGAGGVDNGCKLFGLRRPGKVSDGLTAFEPGGKAGDFNAVNAAGFQRLFREHHEFEPGHFNAGGFDQIPALELVGDKAGGTAVGDDVG